MIVFNENSTKHPESLMSEPIEMLQKACLKLKIKTDACTGRTGTITIYESGDGITYSVTKTISVTAMTMDVTEKIKNCKKEFYKIGYVSSSGTGGSISISINL